MSNKNRNELEAKLIRKVWAEPEFSKEFEADPRLAISKELNIPVEKLPNVVLHKEAVGEWHIVVPLESSVSTDLSEAELENISGGVTPGAVIGSAVFLAGLFGIDAAQSE